MPTLEEYMHLRQIGSAQQEFANLAKMQGHKIEHLANAAINEMTGEDEELEEDEDEEGEGMSEQMRKATADFVRKKKAVVILDPKEDSTRDLLGRETGHFKNSMRPFLP